MQLIHHKLENSNSQLSRIALKADRLRLQKRRWRAVAADGQEFGFELQSPLLHGDEFFQTEKNVYMVVQEPEKLLQVSLSASAAEIAKIGWCIGNLHCQLQITADNIRVVDESSLRILFSKLQVPFQEVTEVFQPFKFSADLLMHHHHH